MDAHEIAHAIAFHWHEEPSALSPEEVHRFRFLMSICDLLGMDHDPINVAHAANLMRKFNYDIPTGDEYPKALYSVDNMGVRTPVLYPHGHEQNGLPVVFHSAEEERDYHNAVMRDNIEHYDHDAE